MDHVAARIVKLEKAIDEAFQKAPPEIRAVIEALQALRGVAQTTAATVVCELGSLSRFESPRKLMGYSGLVTANIGCHSNGVQRRGYGNRYSHLRRVLVEAASACRHRPNVTGFLLRRQKSLAIMRKRRRLPGRHNSVCINATGVAARGKNKNQIVTALGRELLGFIWAIAIETEKQYKRAKIA